ncbi:MAG: transporter [Solirubrobacterales bacterium]|nr:transporter [Solirubrobacterales bacterium]
MLADRYGRKTFLCGGLALLTIGLFAASRARSGDALIASLALAGVGSGLSFPSTLATLTGAVPPERRRMAVSLWAAAVSSGGLLGAMLTGAVVGLASWQAAFTATAACALLALVLVVAVVPETRDPQHTRLDVAGALLSAGAVASLVVGLTEGPVAGWRSAETLGWLAASIVLLAAFVRCERRSEAPLLDVRLFAIPAFSAAVAAMFLMFGGLFAIVFLAYQWEAYVLGFHYVKAGLGLAPMAIFMLPLAVMGTTLSKRAGLKWMPSGALAAGVVGAMLFAWSVHTEAYWTMGLGCVVFGACIGLSAGPGTEAISSPLPAARQGVASAVNDLARELGATLGIAVSGTAFNSVYRSHVSDRLDVDGDPLARAILASPGAGARAIAESGATDPRYHAVLVSATSAGWTAGALTVAGAFFVGLVLFVLGFPNRPQTTNLRDAPDPERARPVADA